MLFRSLSTEYPDDPLLSKTESLYELSAQSAERSAVQLLSNWVNNRTLLLIIENLDEIFNGLGEEGQKRFRAFLQENPYCTILATAQSLFNGVSHQTSPFYGFFRINHLEELEMEDAALLLSNIADLDGNEVLRSFIQTPKGRARLRAVHHLAGGNHRVYVVFSNFLTRDSLDQLVDPFMQTLDDLTPYYNERMKWLSPQQRKIVEFLCDRGHPASVKEISQRSFITHQTTSSQLQLLREMGYVRAISLGRGSYYELREPLMRLCVEVKKHRTEPIRLFVDFLRLWYSKTELAERLATLQPEAQLEKEYLAHALQVSEKEPSDPLVSACLHDHDAYVGKGDWEHALKASEELVVVRGAAEDWAEQAHCLFHLDRFEDALKSCAEALNIDPDQDTAWDIKGMACCQLNRYENAIAAYQAGVRLDPKSSIGWLNLGIVLCNAKRYRESLRALAKSLTLDRGNADTWAHRGTTLRSMRHEKRAIACFDKAIRLDPKHTAAWDGCGIALLDNGQIEEALQSFDKAIELSPQFPWTWFRRGKTLARLGRNDIAVTAYQRSIELGANSACPFFELAEVLVVLNRWEEAPSILVEGLKRAENDDEHVMQHTFPLLDSLIDHTSDSIVWLPFVTKVFELYKEHKFLPSLATSVLSRTPSLWASENNNIAKLWLEAWQAVAGKETSFELALRILAAAVRYRESTDMRILLELPAEERGILLDLLPNDVRERFEKLSVLGKSES